MNTYPYEIHLTVEYNDRKEIFRVICQKVGIKPVIIDLQRDGAVVDVHFMTSSNLHGTLDDAMLAVKQQTWFLEHFDFKVIRYKIESVPWHEDSPKGENEKCRNAPATQYFEAHLQFGLSSDASLKRFAVIVKDFDGAHMSRNPYKVTADGWVQMVTLRSDLNMWKFRHLTDYLESRLYGYKILKIEREFVVVDSNLNHDNTWFLPSPLR